METLSVPESPVATREHHELSPSLGPLVATSAATWSLPVPASSLATSEFPADPQHHHPASPGDQWCLAVIPESLAAPSRSNTPHPRVSPREMLVLEPLALRHAGTWRARVAVARGKQAMTKLWERGNTWHSGDTWRTAGPESPGLQFSVAGDRGMMGEPPAGTRRMDQRSRCSISASRVRAVTHGWARAPRAQEHPRFTKEL